MNKPSTPLIVTSLWAVVTTVLLIGLVVKYHVAMLYGEKYTQLEQTIAKGIQNIDIVGATPTPTGPSVK